MFNIGLRSAALRPSAGWIDDHRRRVFGVVEPVDFVSFEDIEERFERDWFLSKGDKRAS